VSSGTLNLAQPITVSGTTCLKEHRVPVHRLLTTQLRAMWYIIKSKQYKHFAERTAKRR